MLCMFYGAQVMYDLHVCALRWEFGAPSDRRLMRLDGGVRKASVALCGKDATVGVDRRPRELGVTVDRWCLGVDDERRRPSRNARPLEL